MTYEDAYRIVIDLIDGQDGLLDDPATCVSALEIVEERGDGEDDLELCHDVLNLYPGLMNYDRRGNWIGPVANENGRTP